MPEEKEWEQIWTMKCSIPTRCRLSYEAGFNAGQKEGWQKALESLLYDLQGRIGYGNWIGENIQEHLEALRKEDDLLKQARKEGFKAGKQYMRDNAIEELGKVEDDLLKQVRQKTFKTIENWRQQQDFTNMSAGDFSLKLARQLKVLKSKEAGK